MAAAPAATAAVRQTSGSCSSASKMIVGGARYVRVNQQDRPAGRRRRTRAKSSLRRRCPHPLTLGLNAARRAWPATTLSDTWCAANSVGESTSSRDAPSLQVTGTVYFSVCTSSTPASPKAVTAQSTAAAISGEPVKRPPISSVRRRRLRPTGIAQSAGDNLGRRLRAGGVFVHRARLCVAGSGSYSRQRIGLRRKDLLR